MMGGDGARGTFRAPDLVRFKGVKTGLLEPENRELHLLARYIQLDPLSEYPEGPWWLDEPAPELSTVRIPCRQLGTVVQRRGQRTGWPRYAGAETSLKYLSRRPERRLENHVGQPTMKLGTSLCHVGRRRLTTRDTDRG